MGHMIEKVARERGHSIVAVIDADNVDQIDSPEFRSADVAIEFSTPSTAVDLILRAFTSKVPVVSGTTGCFAGSTRCPTCATCVTKEPVHSCIHRISPWESTSSWR